MGHVNFKGMGVALLTPFQTNGEVDYPALARLVEYQLQNGTDYLVVLGTTAETPTLTASEQKEITQFVIDKTNKRAPIVLGVGGNNTKAVVDRLKTDDMKGVDAILSVVPYYNKPSQEGIYQHYKAIAQTASIPVILYNVPGRTGVNMTAETTLRVAHDFDNVIAVKEASGNMAQIATIIKNKPDNFQVISGDDSLTLPLITLGATGIISVIGNALPKEFSRMVHLALSGDYAKALSIHQNLLELFELLFTDGSPAGIKSILNLMGYIENELRLPLVPAQLATQEKIRSALQKLHI
jgi:4-hydroxy-tetrahydrodipicolinate synthase